MKTVEELLLELRSLDVKIWSEGEQLRLKAACEILTSTLLQELKERKVEILSFLDNANTATSSHLPPISPAPRDSNLPLSFAQTRLWFLDQLQPGSSTYNISAAYRLTGSLNVAVLKQSLTEIVQRHEVLRTTFVVRDGQPNQVIASITALTLPVIDLREHPQHQREAIAQVTASKEAQEAFDLSTGPLFRAKLVHLGETEYWLLFNIHHIVSDAWSVGVFFQELTSLYQAFADGKPSPFSPLPIQYADFAHWQHHWLSSEVLESQLSYWKQQLSGVFPILQLPTDYPRPPAQTYQGAYQSLELSQNLVSSLKLLSQQAGVTLFMTLLAAYKTLLYRYSGQEDILVGTPVAGRNQAQTEELMGFFVNTLVLRTNLESNLSFQELLNRVRKVALEAYSHQDLPFEKLVEELQPKRELSISPLFQTMFSFENISSSDFELPGLTVQAVDIDRGTAKFDLTLFTSENKQGLKVSFEYNTDLFAATTITQMLRHFQTLLEGIVANPNQHIQDLPLLTPSDRHQLLQWNETQTNYPNHVCIHQLFEEQVVKTPDAVAVEFEGQQFTYHELNIKANQLAHHLQTLGVAAELPVGICMQRSPEMIVGLLGILKAGGAYVPIDPNYPQQRVSFMLEDAQVSVLITQQQLVKSLAISKIQTVFLDTEWEIISQNSLENLHSSTNAESLAYIIYTSGSTGKPKGVTVSHRAVNRLVLNTNYVQLKPEDRIAQASNAAFDAATFEIWGAILNGARLIIILQDVLLSPQEFATHLHKKQISVLFLTTALFNQLVSLKPQIFKSLRYLLFGGEAVDPKTVREVLEKGSPQYLLHVYGPTESTTFSSYYQIKEVHKTATTVPIGRPIANTQIYILDSNLQPVPIGVPGELYIGGDGLARGYFNQPQLTQEKFIPNLFEEAESRRLYRTGDLARYLPDGNIEFFGRIDHQVKIHGFRIELGEIEAVLSQHPSILQAAVVVHDDVLGEKRLVAYFVAHQSQVSSTSDLRRFLDDYLPEYMIPRIFIPLEALPLNPNGKVDRRALSKSEILSQEPEKTFVAPRDELELELTKIWEKVLAIQPIGVNDNFFDLGGHSLLAARLFAKIQQTLGKNLSLSTLFQAPTVEQLANIIRQSRWSASWLPLVTIQPNGSKPPLFLINALGTGMFAYSNLAMYLNPEQPVYGLQAAGLDGQQDPHTQVEDMAEAYIQAIQTLQPEGAYFLGGLSFGGIIAFEMARLLHSQGHRVGLVALIDSYPPTSLNLIINAPLRNPIFFKGFRNYFPFREVFFLLSDIARVLTDFQFKPQQKLSYALGKIKKVQEKIEHKFEMIIYKLNKSSDRPVPYTVRQALVKEAALKALSNYIPQIYQDKVILFQASKTPDEHLLEWHQLALGGLEIHQIPGDHRTIIAEPNIRILAEKLQTCLNDAQANN